MGEPSLALYIHWPFCKIKCPYCDFNSYKKEITNQSHWLKAYLRALELWSSRLVKREIKSIFFGGGTPSLLDPDFVGLVLQKIDSLWSINGVLMVIVRLLLRPIQTVYLKVNLNCLVKAVLIGCQWVCKHLIIEI